MKTTALALLTLAASAPLLCAGCVTESEATGRQARGMRTEGVIVPGDLDLVWKRTHSVVSSMTTAPLESRGLVHSLRTSVGGTEVTAFVEPYDALRTVVHVASDDPELADRIRMRIMTGG
ncbi:MAG: hypothetical protein AAGB93_21010 [Planctomycetota bacterium]